MCTQRVDKMNGCWFTKSSLWKLLFNNEIMIMNEIIYWQDYLLSILGSGHKVSTRVGWRILGEGGMEIFDKPKGGSMKFFPT